MVTYNFTRLRTEWIAINPLYRAAFSGGKNRMKAVIYTTNSGSTAEYAQLLGEEWNLPVFSLQQPNVIK